MSRPRAPQDPDRVIAEGTRPSRGSAGDANALWRYERHRRRNLQARPGPLPVALVLDRLKPDFNVPKIFRSAEAFGAHAVHLIDIGPFDPAPAKGGFKHVPARWWHAFAPCREALEAEGFALIALSPEAPDLLHDIALPPRVAFVVGHELGGLSEETRNSPGLHLARLPQWGQLDSLNVAVAASVALYEFVRQRAGSMPRDGTGSLPTAVPG
ncbi:MAG TPA: TrmH family RNA methyltransferase [Xanthomonadaceae bacterium]|nr:TrmH family RNA methyltransferase [Xanthomonadaceae bacterium]